MKSDVQEYIKACPKCVQHNPKLPTDAPPLNSIPVPSQVWSMVRIDLIGPLQETVIGNKYIVAVTDHFSKWSEDTLISDQGREFINQIMDYLLDKLQTDHRIASAYHPQTNGQRERDNRTLKTDLGQLVSDDCDNWDTLIPGVLFAYHTSVHASTQCTL